jgi:hypothetical protein
MAASSVELRRIYVNLFREPYDPGRLSELQASLDAVDRRRGSSRAAADRILESLNDGLDPGLTFTQLECLRSFLSARAFASVVPTEALAPEIAEELAALYRRLFAEPDLGNLQALQRAVFDYDKTGTDEKRLAVLALLQDLNPRMTWNDAHVGALDALLVRDITFKQIAPFQVSGDVW